MFIMLNFDFFFAEHPPDEPTEENAQDDGGYRDGEQLSRKCIIYW